MALKLADLLALKWRPRKPLKRLHSDSTVKTQKLKAKALDRALRAERKYLQNKRGDALRLPLALPLAQFRKQIRLPAEQMTTLARALGGASVPRRGLAAGVSMRQHKTRCQLLALAKG